MGDSFFVMLFIHKRTSLMFSYDKIASLCSLIDEGKNPDEFTRDVLNSCIAKNQITKGKADSFKVKLYTKITAPICF